MKNELKNYMLDKLIPTTFPTIKIVEIIKSFWDLVNKNFDINPKITLFQHTFPVFDLQLQIYTKSIDGCYFKTSNYDLKIVALEYHIDGYFILYIGDHKKNFQGLKLKVSLSNMSFEIFADIYDQNNRIFNQYKKYNNLLMLGKNFMNDFGETIFKIKDEDYFVTIPDYEFANLFMKLEKIIKNGRRTF